MPDSPETLYDQMKRELRTASETLRNEWRELRASFDDPNHWGRSVRAGTGEVTDYYLTAEQRERLKTMRPAKALLYRTGWVFRALFERLAPERRVVAIIGVLLILISHKDNSYDIVGGLFLLVVIMLELKDKLTAHDELAEGRRIQEMLMPERAPAVPGWSVWLFTRSANEVCGDLIDVLRTEEGRVRVTIADVAGKGLHAALLTTKLQATVRALASEHDHLDALVARVNAIFHRDSPSHIFASLFAAEFVPDASGIRYVNAGHLPAIVRRAGALHETGKGDMALGLSTKAEFHAQTEELVPGDLFVMYSDGLTEATNLAGEFFGRERLLSFLRDASGPSDAIGRALLRRVDEFAGTARATDDLSLIILQRLPDPPSSDAP